MKIILLLLFVFLSIVPLSAQPILIASNASPAGGEVFVRHTCGVSSFTYGASGSGVVWNFSGLHTNTIDTVSYIACSGSGLCDSFPGAAVTYLSGGTYRFYLPDTNRFALSGQTTPLGDLYYSRPRPAIIYPATYGSVAADTFAFSQLASLSFGYGYDSLFADGYGTLLLPSGTYTNVLRIHTIQNNIDSSVSGGSSMVDTFRTDVYSWYTPGFHSPLLSMYYDFGSTGVPLLAQVLYYTQGPTGVPVAEVGEDEIQVYPNPAVDMLSIDIHTFDEHSLVAEICDVTGHLEFVIKEELTAGHNTIVLNLPYLKPGIYFLRLVSEGAVMVQKIIIGK